ncbi:MAG: DUF1223 domain-containing protein [Paracoccaceae bacterium]
MWIAALVPASAEPVVVVELYTSQGCSSCPPADALMEEIAEDPRVIPLSLHVDYWDYIGWADSFADPKFTARQKAYARAAGSRTIYTPQMIVDGEDRIEGYDPEEIAEHLKKHLAESATVHLVVQRQGNVLVIRAEADPPLSAPVRVQLVRYKPEETVQIERGENAGQTVTYRNIVTSWDGLGDWTGLQPLEISAHVEGPDQTVVILQEDGPASILAAARAD